MHHMTWNVCCLVLVWICPCMYCWKSPFLHYFPDQTLWALQTESTVLSSMRLDKKLNMGLLLQHLHWCWNNIYLVFRYTFSPPLMESCPWEWNATLIVIIHQNRSIWEQDHSYVWIETVTWWAAQMTVALKAFSHGEACVLWPAGEAVGRPCGPCTVVQWGPFTERSLGLGTGPCAHWWGLSSCVFSCLAESPEQGLLCVFSRCFLQGL